MPDVLREERHSSVVGIYGVEHPLVKRFRCSKLAPAANKWVTGARKGYVDVGGLYVLIAVFVDVDDVLERNQAEHVLEKSAEQWGMPVPAPPPLPEE